MEIDPKLVAHKYNKLQLIWDPKDKWHMITHQMIKKFILNSVSKINKRKEKIKILNAGSAGYSYGISEEDILHVDIAKDRISHLSNSIIANIEEIPIPDQQFDLIICVGSVLNYCDPLKVIKEFSRLLNKKGYLILEFENSRTLELLGKKVFSKKAILVDTFYNGNVEKIWYFSEKYIKQISKLNGFKLLNINRCHVLSPFLYRIFKDEHSAAKWSILDRFCSMVPILNKFSSNSILLLSNATS